VLKLNAGGPDCLIDRKAGGRPPRLTDEHRAALAAVIESGPIPAIHGVVRWRLARISHRHGRRGVETDVLTAGHPALV
jgi:transposase